MNKGPRERGGVFPLGDLKPSVILPPPSPPSAQREGMGQLEYQTMPALGEVAHDG
jgi:hypothetical protein